MLLYLLECIGAVSPAKLAALEKITFRASACAAVSFLLALAFGPRLISWLASRFREPIKGDSERLNELHRSKQATPTMGGLFLVAGLVGGLLLFADLRNRFVQVALVVTIGLALLGMIDDLSKIFGLGNGLRARTKLAGQLLVAGLAVMLLWHHHARIPGGLNLQIPLLTEVSFSLGLWFMPVAALVIVGASNAVNLTDGLDGLAAGCLILATAAMAALAYVSGHAELAAYLHVLKIPGSGEMTVVAGGMIGGLLGFLWFNCHPAQVFMGDTGSLPLGGLLGLFAVVTRQELLLLLIGGVFVAEAASVILQVCYYKWRHRRVLRCAPLHHHFQFLGWPETRVVTRLWIVAGLCAILGVAVLKFQVRQTQATLCEHPPFATASAAASTLVPDRR